MVAEYSRTLEEIAKPFIESGIYASTGAFVSNLVKFSAGKICKYERKIKAFEAKYGSFEDFTRKIRGKASPMQEDQWMEWEAAINLLNAWKRLACELLGNDVQEFIEKAPVMSDEELEQIGADIFNGVDIAKLVEDRS